MSGTLPTVSISEAKSILKHLFDTIGEVDSQGIFLWGPPGIGKSALVKQLAQERGLELVDLRLPLLDPVDLRGLPMVDIEQKQAIWLPPDFLPKTNSPPGILFLDEINAASPAIQASAYQLILDRRVGTYHLPPKWIVIAAGNRVTDRSVAYRLPTALANRFTHLEITPNIEEWTQWAWQNNIDPLIISFLRYQPDVLMNFNPRSNATAFPSPRSWSFVSRMNKLRDVNFILYINAVQGTIGEAAKQQFISFLNYRDNLPNPADILDGNPYELPVELDSLYVLMGGLIRFLVDKPTNTRISNFYHYAVQFDGTQFEDYGIVLVKEMINAFKQLNKFSTLIQHPEYLNWIKNHKNIISLK